MILNKRMKQLFSVVTALCIVLTFTAAYAVAEKDENPLAEQGAQAFDKLTALGIFNEEEGYPSGTEVSRAVFTRLAMKLSGYPVENLNTQDNIFEDVTAETENADYIAAAYSLGYISGNPEGAFYPDDTITCAQALKMLSGVLGYGVYAEAKGGYPTGYLMTAKRLKLLDGLKLATEAPLTWDEAVIMLDNAVEADLMEIISLIDPVEMQVIPERTLLSERFSVYKATAVIEENEYTALMSPDSDLRSGTVLAGGSIFDTGDTAAADYLGMNMELYYYKSDTVAFPELRYIMPVKNENKVLELEPEDVLSLSQSGSELNYIDSKGKSVTARLSATASLIWNGKLADLQEEKLKPKSGTVTLISNDGDSVYDVIKVMDYETYVVSAVSSVTGAVGVKQGVSLNLDTTDSSYFTVIKQDGQTVNFDAIQPNMTLSYAESENEGTIVKTALLSDKTISGAIESVNKNERLLTIDGNAYETTEELANSLAPGREGSFYFDAFDRIVYIDGTLDIVYGYLNGLSVESFGDVRCRIFTENNRWVTLQMNSKVKYNGESLKAEAVVGLLGNTENEYRQIIRYRVNSEGKITVLDTAAAVTMGTDEDKTAIADNTFRLSASGDETYRNTTATFGGVVTVNSSAKIFVVPNQNNGTKEDDFDIKGRKDLKADTNYVFEAYDANRVRTSSIFVIEPPDGSISLGKLMIVQNAGQILNSERISRPAINGYWEGKEFMLPVNLKTNSPIQDINTLQEGDIIQFAYNKKGELDYITKRYTAGTEYSLTGAVYSIDGYVAGTILAIDNTEKRMVLQYNAQGSSAVYSVSSTDVYIYDTQNAELEIGTTADLMEGDRVFASVRYLLCKELFVIRN